VRKVFYERTTFYARPPRLEPPRRSTRSARRLLEQPSVLHPDGCRRAVGGRWRRRRGAGGWLRLSVGAAVLRAAHADDRFVRAGVVAHRTGSRHGRRRWGPLGFAFSLPRYARSGGGPSAGGGAARGAAPFALRAGASRPRLEAGARASPRRAPPVGARARGRAGGAWPGARGAAGVGRRRPGLVSSRAGAGGLGGRGRGAGRAGRSCCARVAGRAWCRLCGCARVVRGPGAPARGLVTPPYRGCHRRRSPSFAGSRRHTGGPSRGAPGVRRRGAPERVASRGHSSGHRRRIAGRARRNANVGVDPRWIDFVGCVFPRRHAAVSCRREPPSLRGRSERHRRVA
jgi:hypothetical protein